MSTQTGPAPTDLIGRWRLTRSIEDRRAGELSHLDGVTTIEQESDRRLRWSEQGTLHRQGVAIAAGRTLLIERDGEDWAVHFEDGRPFHPWRPGELVDHSCPPDLYRGMIAGTDTIWTVVWEARGPAKDYRIESTLVREDER